jgi:mannose-6-phosphate isomerase-like protein (cupin superfamily)
MSKPNESKATKLKVLIPVLMLLAAGFLPIAILYSLADDTPFGIHYIDHDKVSATMAKSGTLVHDPGLIVLAERRKAGPAQYHERTSHVFIMVDGEATLVVGGTMVDPKQISPTEMQASSIEGGQTYHLTKGDVITIPAKTPHWFKEVPTGNSCLLCRKHRESIGAMHARLIQG